MAPIISRQHLPTFPDIFDSILLIRTRRVEGDDIGDQITLRRLHSNVSPSPEYDSGPALPAPRLPAHPHLTQPPAPPVTLCISAPGGKHYTGLAQGTASLNILSWLLAVILLVTRVSSPTFIRTRATGGVGEGRAASSTRR